MCTARCGCSEICGARGVDSAASEAFRGRRGARTTGTPMSECEGRRCARQRVQQAGDRADSQARVQLSQQGAARCKILQPRDSAKKPAGGMPRGRGLPRLSARERASGSRRGVCQEQQRRIEASSERAEQGGRWRRGRRHRRRRRPRDGRVGFATQPASIHLIELTSGGLTYSQGVLAGLERGLTTTKSFAWSSGPTVPSHSHPR